MKRDNPNELIEWSFRFGPADGGQRQDAGGLMSNGTIVTALLVIVCIVHLCFIAVTLTSPLVIFYN